MHNQSLILSTCGTAIDAVMPTIASLLEAHVHADADRPAMRFEGRQYSYGDLDRDVQRAAAALSAHGVTPDDRLCFIGKNSATYFILLYACARVGAVMVPIGWRLAQSEMLYMVEDAGARLIFADQSCLAAAQELAELAGDMVQVIAVEGDGGDAFEAWLKGYAGKPIESLDDPDRPFIQLYTSGTTGRPKGVPLTPSNFFGMRMRCRDEGVDWDQWSPADVAYVAMPIAHVGGSGYGLMALFHGALAHVEREFSPGGLLEAISNDGVSKFFIVPTALQIALNTKGAREIDFSRVKHIIYGASPISLPLLREALEVTGAQMCQQYGMTETSGTIVALPPADHTPEGSHRMRSAGKPLPGVDLKIIDDTGEIVPLGTVGEIVVRSDANMAGYWKLPEATAATVDKDGWLRTGDAAYLDADGYVYICDRLKDMICSGGENVYAAEVEAVLFDCPGISEAAVIGVPDDKWGEAVKAVVVPKAGVNLDPADVLRRAREKLAGFKMPKSIDIVESLPKNATGKILKHELRKPYWVGREKLVN